MLFYGVCQQMVVRLLEGRVKSGLFGHAVGSIHYSRCWFFFSWALPGHVASRGKGLQNKSLMRCEANAARQFG